MHWATAACGKARAYGAARPCRSRGLFRIMRVYQNVKRRRLSGSGNPVVVRMGEQVLKLKMGETERFVMNGVCNPTDQSLWRSRLSNHVRVWDPHKSSLVSAHHGCRTAVVLIRLPGRSLVLLMTVSCCGLLLAERTSESPFATLNYQPAPNAGAAHQVPHTWPKATTGVHKHSCGTGCC